ncbi:MAG TPA: helix-turn-helix domain-containing protein, partial [Methanomicrobiales archaeon]|nr:helix-turn-helix domain-containing protein [Methanomicrobiales archaeon]
ANEPYPFILGIVLRQEAIPNRIVLTGDTLDVIVSARDWELFREIADEVQEKLDAFELKKVTEIENPGEPLDSGRLSELLVNKLTADQLAVLGTAYELGYFDVPRQKSAVEVAEALDISQSTFSERLRRAERNLFELIYGRQE